MLHPAPLFLAAGPWHFLSGPERLPGPCKGLAPPASFFQNCLDPEAKKEALGSPVGATPGPLQLQPSLPSFLWVCGPGRGVGRPEQAWGFCVLWGCDPHRVLWG